MGNAIYWAKKLETCDTKEKMVKLVETNSMIHMRANLRNNSMTISSLAVYLYEVQNGRRRRIVRYHIYSGTVKSESPCGNTKEMAKVREETAELVRRALKTCLKKAAIKW